MSNDEPLLDDSSCHYDPNWEIQPTEQMTTTYTPRTDACPHPKPKLMLLGSHWHWCTACGAAQRLVEGKPFGNWRVPEATELMRKFIDFMDDSLGNTADWPMEANFDNEKDSQKFCSLLNAMKRIVNPEDIN